MKITELTLNDKVYKLIYERMKFDNLISSEVYPTIVCNPIVGIRKLSEGVYRINYNEKYDHDKSEFSKKCWLDHDGVKVIKQAAEGPTTLYEETRDIGKYCIDSDEAIEMLHKLCDDNIKEFMNTITETKTKISKLELIRGQKTLPISNSFQYKGTSKEIK